jgi:mono/diheme cytochrome c family protein
VRRLLVLLSSFALAACHCGPAPVTNERSTAPRDFMVASPEVLRRGAEVFRERCSPCHGDSGYGDGVLATVLPIRPRNYHADPFRWGRTPAGIVETVALGRSGVMPSFRGAIDEADMWAVAQVVWAWMPASERQEDAPDTLEHWRQP